MKKQLEVGDVLYTQGMRGFDRHIIDRVTKTQAIAKHTKFCRNSSHDVTFKVLGMSGYRTSYGYLETPELKERYLRQNAIAAIMRTLNRLQRSEDKIEKLSNGELKDIFQAVARIENDINRKP